MLDHIGFPVSNFERSTNFYAAALAPLGITSLMKVTKQETGDYEGAGFGSEGKPYFWVGAGSAIKGRLHVAFVAKTRKSVDAFYAAAIKAGGKDNGAPGIRAHYHPNYYSAFVLDPDGHNIEAVCHR